MPAPLDLLLRRLARHRNHDHTLARWCPLWAASTMGAGTLVAVIRLALPEGAWLVPALMTAGILAPVVLLPRLLGRREPPTLIAGHLDRLAGADGLVMALAECPSAERDAGWLAKATAALGEVRLPPLDLRPLAGAALGLACLLGAGLIPQATPAPTTTAPGDAARPLRQEVAALAQAQVLTPEEHHDLDQQLARLTANGLDQATWQGLDRLDQQLQQQADAAGARLAAALQAATAAVEAGGTHPNEAGDPTQVAAQAAALGQALAELAATAPALLPALPADASQEAMAKALDEAVRQGRLTADQARQMAAVMAKAGTLGKPGAGGKPGGNGRGPLSASEGRALARELQQALAGKAKGLGTTRARSALQRFLAGHQDQDGTPGVSQGPGHPHLDHVPRERLDGGQAAALAEGLTENPDGSVTIATRSRDPVADAAARTALARAAAREFDPTAADSRRAGVAPRHRAAVQAYFAADPTRPTAPAPGIPPATARPTIPAPRPPPADIP